MRIDVYDFDGTIYDGDSTVDFTRFCLRRHPAVLAGLPRFIGTSVLLALGRRNLTQFKSVLFGEMAKRFSLEKEAELFWQDERTRAKLGWWFFDRPRDLPIVIASASPEFELQYAAKILGVPPAHRHEVRRGNRRADRQKLQGRGEAAPHRGSGRRV